MDISLLVKVTSKAWSLKILSLMHRGVPGRQAALLAASGASRTTFVHSLRHLESLNLLERNPGHGHPLRPEFRLTQLGEVVATVAKEIDEITLDETGSSLLRKAWTIPVLAVVSQPKKFSDLKLDLNPITDRALSNSLKILSNQNWIERSVDIKWRPPRPYYQAINEGAEINRVVRSSFWEYDEKS
ncbi:winged helix-turn-helix transcriptional regulator [Terasakiella sp. A23]|uniref:winged helix-turn-helix transcriptional regulator n=1 Tax=Terasakiella sp. FCG-A23 TaxID=3080561 RepID=UPI0029545F6D|nr:winged helix-turn-helix transcriptional regulator [Terasakiella sp. A23]MDV7340364.1 winged helix-turn-helix transcriptional regulator [Terasakiella sp. A23]